MDTQELLQQYDGDMYLRISHEDGDKAESDSIANQRDLITAFLEKHPEITLRKVWVDDGYTGVNFDRPDFIRMMESVRNKKTNCIIVKDDCVIIEPTQKDLENQGFVAGSICF